MSDKNAYEEKQQARLDEWAAEIDKLKAKAELADAEARIKLDEEIKQAETMQQKVEHKLAQLRSSTDDAWGDIKHGLESAADSLGSSLRSAASRFS